MDKYDDINNSSEFDIAVVGMACRFPGANNAEEFWDNLKHGIDGLTHFSEEECIADGIPEDIVRDKNYVKVKGLMDNVDKFDAGFFGMNPRAAETMDPQHRIFLETSWEALEHAGYDPEKYPGRIGVYAGSSFNTYMLSILKLNAFSLYGMDLQGFIDNDKDALTTSVAYRLNLRGPAITIQASSATSLVSVCVACDSLLDYRSDMALAGGISANFPIKSGYLHLENSITSSDGYCRSFDADADGFAYSDGAGIVVLKRLSDAVEDGDTIHAVIKGTAVVNDGSRKVSYNALSMAGLKELFSEAVTASGIHPETISYVEGHGSGTKMGDPIEVNALSQVYRNYTHKKQYCALGSVKSNFGHMDVAAGVTGLIKTVLSLKHKQIPPSLNFRKPNPEMNMEESPFYVNSELREWKTDGFPRRAGLSSLGMGGTHSHIILEEAPDSENSGSSRSWQLLMLSAKTKSALDRATENLSRHIAGHSELNLADAAYTLQQGRQEFSHRRMVLCKDWRHARSELDRLIASDENTTFQKPGSRSLFFIFPGSGRQFLNMGKDLYKEEKYFQRTFDQCAGFLESHLDVPLRDIVFSESESVLKGANLANPLYGEPVLFAVEYALGRLWMEWLGKPSGMIGFGVGEYVAACLSGVLSLEDALLLAVQRGRVMQSLPQYVSKAMAEGQSDLTLDREDIDFEGFKEDFSKMKINEPQISYLSGVTEDWVEQHDVSQVDYWISQICQPAGMELGLQKIGVVPNPVFLEIGPGLTVADQISKDLIKPSVLKSMVERYEKDTEIQQLLSVLGQLWLEGVKIDWNAFYANERRKRIPLPTYSFDRKRYWYTAAEDDVNVSGINLEKIMGSKNRYARPELGNEYVAPQTDLEKTFSAIFEDVLGIDRVGMEDDFFELGGDSLLGLNVVSKISQQGFHIPMLQTLSKATISEILKVKKTQLSIKQEMFSGDLPLLCNQNWLFEQNHKNIHRWNAHFYLESAIKLLPELVEETAIRLVKHHDGLRCTFHWKDGEWKAHIKEYAGENPFIYVDLAALSAEEQIEEIEKQANDFQDGFKLEEGALFKIILFDTGDKQAQRIFFLAHHLVVDTFSWTIICEDFQTVYQQLRDNLPVNLPPKTHSLKEIAEQHYRFPTTEKGESEIDYWLNFPWEYTPMPMDREGSVRNEASTTDYVGVSLTEEETSVLLQDVFRTYDVTVLDVLFTALLKAWTDWTQGKWFQVLSTDSGRQPLIEDEPLDISRTVGWICIDALLMLERTDHDSVAELLESVKDQLKRVPTRGMGYKLLKYYHQDQEIVENLDAINKNEIKFNYFGQVRFGEDPWFKFAYENVGDSGESTNENDVGIYCGAGIQGNVFSAYWFYSTNILTKSTMEKLAGDFIGHLRSLIKSCQKEKNLVGLGT